MAMNHNKVSLVTGAAGGIGKACALALGKAGAGVAVADIRLVQAQQTAAEIIAEGGRALAVEMDVSSEDDVNRGVARCVEYFGGLDVLVSNAGVQIVHPIEEYPFEEWKRMMAIHADGAFLTAKAAFAHMKKSGRGGKIIFMGSVHSHEGSRLKSAYCFAKHGLLGLSKVLAREGGAHGIHTYTICPGFVRTPLVDKQLPEQAQALGITEAQVISDVMLKDTVDGCFTTLEDVAGAVLAAANDSGAMTGQSILLGHGWHMN